MSLILYLHVSFIFVFCLGSLTSNLENVHMRDASDIDDDDATVSQKEYELSRKEAELGRRSDFVRQQQHSSEKEKIRLEEEQKALLAEKDAVLAEKASMAREKQQLEDLRHKYEQHNQVASLRITDERRSLSEQQIEVATALRSLSDQQAKLEIARQQIEEEKNNLHHQQQQIAANDNTEQQEGIARRENEILAAVRELRNREEGIENAKRLNEEEHRRILAEGVSLESRQKQLSDREKHVEQEMERQQQMVRAEQERIEKKNGELLQRETAILSKESFETTVKNKSIGKKRRILEKQPQLSTTTMSTPAVPEPAASSDADWTGIARALQQPMSVEQRNNISSQLGINQNDAMIDEGDDESDDDNEEEEENELEFVDAEDQEDETNKYDNTLLMQGEKDVWNKQP